MARLAHVTSSENLGEVDVLLHDRGFSLEDVTFDATTGVAQIPFLGSDANRDFSFRGHRPSTDPPPLSLVVHHVTDLVADDPNRLVEHSYAQLRSEGATELTLSSNFEGGIRFSVRAIDVEVNDEVPS